RRAVHCAPARELLAGLRTRLAERPPVRPARRAVANRRQRARARRRARRSADDAVERGDRALCRGDARAVRRRPRGMRRRAGALEIRVAADMAGRTPDPRARRACAARGRAAIPFGRDELARAFDGRTPASPQGQGLQPHVAPFDLPRQAFEDVIDGVAMDLDTMRYQTFDDLFQYCRRVASAVGLICIRIFGCTSARAVDYALNLGVALQLTNILRDVSDDLARGRVYLPLED